jgi:hypothetical protein
LLLFGVLLGLLLHLTIILMENVMNLPIKTETKLQDIVNAWLHEDAPVTMKMSILPEHKQALVKRLKLHMQEELYKAYDDGFNDARDIP